MFWLHVDPVRLIGLYAQQASNGTGPSCPEAVLKMYYFTTTFIPSWHIHAHSVGHYQASCNAGVRSIERREALPRCYRTLCTSCIHQGGLLAFVAGVHQPWHAVLQAG